MSRPTLLPAASDRWSMRVELKDDEIARLYAQGLTRGALVWRAGMPEWRPLLITPELSRLLHSTPITLRKVSDPSLDDELTLPRPARLPAGMSIERNSVAAAKDVPTVAPTAQDITPASAAPLRRRIELVAVAALAFGLAWFAREASLEPPSPLTAAAPLAPPSPVAQAEPRDAAPTLLASGSGIPVVSLADLPLLGNDGRRSTVSASLSGERRSRARQPARAAGGGPTRAELLSALNQVASVASGCGERDGPVRVVISFAPSGVARSIQVSGKGLPSPVRSCIIGAASRARVGSFSGEPVTVSKTL